MGNKEIYSNLVPVTAVSFPHEKDNVYFSRLAKVKLAMALKYSKGCRVLDVCCGAGDFLLSLDGAASRVGLDFVDTFVAAGAGNARDKAVFVCADAVRLPFKAASFDLVYSFASLYSIPDFGRVLREMVCITAPQGILILDLGNKNSVNAFTASRSQVSGPKGFYQSLPVVQKLFRDNGLEVLEERCFQILPYWGNKPSWLKPILHRRVAEFAAVRIGGFMIDEIVSSLPIVKRFSFRHIFVCRKRS
jgi:ubiquinone/menaquinone biosynthesis C-methylase UbiE